MTRTDTPVVANLVAYVAGHLRYLRNGSEADGLPDLGRPLPVLLAVLSGETPRSLWNIALAPAVIRTVNALTCLPAVRVMAAVFACYSHLRFVGMLAAA